MRPRSTAPLAGMGSTRRRMTTRREARQDRKGASRGKTSDRGPLSGLEFKPTQLTSFDQWVDSVDRDTGYTRAHSKIIATFRNTAIVAFRGPLLAVEGINEASTTVPTTVTASSGEHTHDLFKFVLEIPFISDSDVRRAISVLELLLRDGVSEENKDSEESARAFDLFGIDSANSFEELEEDLERLRRDGWKLPGHYKFVIGQKLVWWYQPRSFQAGAEAVHDFSLKVLHGKWSFWPLVNQSGVQLSVPGRIPPLVDLPGLAKDGTVRDWLVPRYLGEKPANTYVFLVKLSGQMEEFKKLFNDEDFVRQALLRERERRLPEGEVNSVPPVLLFVSLFDKSDLVKNGNTRQEIMEMLAEDRELLMTKFKRAIRLHLKEVFTSPDEGAENASVLTIAEIEELIRMAEQNNTIQYQFVCTYYSNDSQDEVVATLNRNMRRSYEIQNDLWMAWLRKNGNAILNEEEYQQQLLKQTSDMHKRLQRALRQFHGDRDRRNKIKDTITGHLDTLAEHLDACLKDAKKLSTRNNLDVWRAQQGLTTSTAIIMGLKHMGENNKILAWLLTAAYRKLSYRFYNGHLAEYRRLMWVRQLARDITNTILQPRRLTGVAGERSATAQGGAGPSSGQPQASVGSCASGPGDEDGSIIEMQWNKVYASVLQVLIDGVYSALSAITPHDLRTVARKLALLGDYFPQLAKYALESFKGPHSTHERYKYLSIKAPELVEDTAENITEAFQDYLGAWADKATADIVQAVTNLSNMGLLGGLGEGQQFNRLLLKFQQELFKLDGRQPNVAPPPRDDEPGPSRAPQRRPQTQDRVKDLPGPINTDLDALRQMTAEEWVKYSTYACRQVLVDLRVFPREVGDPLEYMKGRCMQRKLLFKHLTEFLQRDEEPQDRRVRPRH
eukprot:jgi/Mesvir1/14916/Mv05511-RA.1